MQPRLMIELEDEPENSLPFRHVFAVAWTVFWLSWFVSLNVVEVGLCLVEIISP